jgi:hypothetical protein
LLSGCLALNQLVSRVGERVGACLEIVLRYIRKRVEIESRVRVAKEIQEICAILDIFLVESWVCCMINHLLLGVQPSNFDHFSSRIKSLKKVLCYRLKLVFKSAT